MKVWGRDRRRQRRGCAGSGFQASYLQNGKKIYSYPCHEAKPKIFRDVMSNMYCCYFLTPDLFTFSNKLCLLFKYNVKHIGIIILKYRRQNKKIVSFYLINTQPKTEVQVSQYKYNNKCPEPVIKLNNTSTVTNVFRHQSLARYTIFNVWAAVLHKRGHYKNGT